MKHSFMVGDSVTDIEAGKNAGCRTILVRTGHGNATEQAGEIECDFVANDLFGAAGYILSES